MMKTPRGIHAKDEALGCLDSTKLGIISIGEIRYCNWPSTKSIDYPFDEDDEKLWGSDAKAN